MTDRYSKCSLIDTLLLCSLMNWGWIFMKSYVKISVLSKIFLVIPNLTNIIFHFKVSDYLYSTIQINENIVVLVLWVNDEWLQSFLYTVWFDLLLLGIQNKCQTNSYSCTEEKKHERVTFSPWAQKSKRRGCWWLTTRSLTRWCSFVWTCYKYKCIHTKKYTHYQPNLVKVCT